MDIAPFPHIVVAHSSPLLGAGIAEALRAVNRYRVTVAEGPQSWPAADLVVTCRLGARAIASVAPVLVIDQRPRGDALPVLLQHGVMGYLMSTCQADELCRAVAYLLGGSSYICPLLLNRVLKLPESARLTLRETEVLQVLAQGHGNKIIARRLAISEDTVKTHMKHLMAKLGAASRTQAVALAAQRGLVDIRLGEAA